MTAVSDETGRDVLQSPQHIIEGVILRRLHDKRIEGYTLEMSKEIAAALSAAPVGEPLRRIVLDTLNAVATAVENLSVHQEQCDRDGVMVKVSRQALDEVLNAVNEVAMQSAITASPAAPVAQEPVAIQSLEWAEDDDNGRPMHRARTDVGPVYTIYDDGFSMPPYRLQIHQLHLGSYYNVGPAKDAAQADYEKRIRSALSIPPATSAGVGADEIARVLKPFASLIEAIECTTSHPMRDADTWSAPDDAGIVTIGDLRKARDLLALLSRGSGSDQQRSQKDGSR